MGAPLPRRPPPARPGLALTPPSAPCPWAAFGRATVNRGGQTGGAGRGGEARRLGRGRWTPAPPTLTSGPSLPGGTDTAAAEREPGGGGGTGGGARDHSSGGDLVRRRQFGSSIFLPSER